MLGTNLEVRTRYAAKRRKSIYAKTNRVTWKSRSKVVA